MSDYAGPAEGVMRRRRQRAEMDVEDAPRDAPKRWRANESDVARGGELGVGDTRGGASAGGASGAAASRGAPARAGRGGAAGAAPERATLPRAAKSRHPLARVDPNRQRDPLEARGDGAGGARGAPVRRARPKGDGDDRRASSRRAFERWREARAAAVREREAARVAARVAALRRAFERWREARAAAVREQAARVARRDRAALIRERRQQAEIDVLARAAAGLGDWPPGIPNHVRAEWVDAVRGRHALAGVPAEDAADREPRLPRADARARRMEALRQLRERLRRGLGNIPLDDATPRLAITSMASLLAGERFVQREQVGPFDQICRYCSARVMQSEVTAKMTICCGSVLAPILGIKRIPAEGTAERKIVDLWGSDTPEGRVLRKYPRAVNNAFAMTSQKTSRRAPLPPGRGGWQPCYTLQGRPMSFHGPLQPDEGVPPVFAQVYANDPEMDGGAGAIEIRIGNVSFPSTVTAAEKVVLRDVFRHVGEWLQECNPYIRDYHTLLSMPAERAQNMRFVINANARPEGEHERRYNRPEGLGLQEVSVLIGNDLGRRDFELQIRGGGVRVIDDTHRAYLALHFPMLFPAGDDGWYSAMKLPGGQRNLSPGMWIRFHLHRRPAAGQRDILFLAGRLFQEFTVIGFSTLEHQRLRWMRQEQKTIRADLYQNVRDHVRNGDGGGANALGRRVILAPSFCGGGRWQQERYLNSLAVSRVVGRADLFITFTCNPAWPEITAELLEGQKSTDRPDVVVRVFMARLNKFLTRLKTCFGIARAWTCVNEFQKRGLPHTHTLLHVGGGFGHSAAGVDSVCCAEIPSEPGPMRDAVLRHMTHGPCGDANPNAPCMKDGRCSKGFPHPFTRETTIVPDGYPKLRRRSPEDGGQRVVLDNGRVVDNRWVVPYNPYLLAVENAHVNVLIVANVQVVKYLYKYIYKGGDRAMAAIAGNWNEENRRRGGGGVGVGGGGGGGRGGAGGVGGGGGGGREQVGRDEITEYEDFRCVGATEAAWRIFEYPISIQYPPVILLRVHLENHQEVRFEDDDDERVNAIAEGEPPKTMLTEWLRLNAQAAENGDDPPPMYAHMPGAYTWRNQAWHPRRGGASASIGRMPYISPTAGDVHFLRDILLQPVSRGAVSFEALRTVGGVVHGTFLEACRALGLMQDDRQWHETMAAAAEHQMPAGLRGTFVIVLIYSLPTDPAALFATFWERMADDFTRVVTNARGTVDAVRDGVEELDVRRAMLLLDLEDRVRRLKGNATLESEHLPAIASPEARREALRLLRRDERSEDDSRELREESAYDAPTLARTCRERMAAMNVNQRQFLDAALRAVRENEPKCFFLDAPAGTGKTYCLNTLLAGVRGDGKIAIAVATSGIASILLSGGRTFHSRFKAPLKLREGQAFGVRREDGLAVLLRRVSLIVWDEAAMCNRKLLEGLDQTLRFLRDDESVPFGGSPWWCRGTFARTSPSFRTAIARRWSPPPSSDPLSGRGSGPSA